ncbi:MAG: FtsX-like permease family protein [Lachnospiraceae bacterium]|nr:FtsX-like permease family protein [Lachnospiraceae bacterium]
MLRKKMFRDIRQNLSQFITIFLMVWLGVLAYAGIRSYMDGMTTTAEVFYRENNLQDLNAVGTGFTDEEMTEIRAMDGVKAAERKLTLLATMVSEKDLTLQVNFIESNEIAQLYVFEGAEFDADNDGIWLDRFYAQNNDLKVGDTITLKYGDLELTREIAALVNVPDHVYDIKDESAIFPDHKDYGFCYLSAKELPETMRVFSTCMIDVEEKKQVAEVKTAIEEQIESVIVVTKAEDSTSYAVYQGEVEEGETYVGVFSGLFLFIAMLSVVTTMTRVVKKQRIQIGTLKALGFSKKKITRHYVGYGFWISLAAAITGLIAGALIIGNLFMSMEMAVFQIPNGAPAVKVKSLVVAACVVLIVCLVTWLTCRKELKESPAETLRTKKIKVNKETLAITTKGVFGKLGFASKWNLRDILRNKLRTFMGVAGITGCCLLLVCALGMYDSIQSFIGWQFDDLYNFEYKLSLDAACTEEEYNQLTADYGTASSMMLGIEVEQGNEKEANTAFVTDAGDYVRVTDHDREFITMKDDGVYITEKLAKLEGYELGDTVRWHVFGSDTWYESEIVGFDRDPQNQNLKMTRKYAESIGVIYQPDTLYTNADLSEVKALAGVELIQNVETLKTGMQSMVSAMTTMVVLISVVAAVLGCVIIYNLGILSFTEKQYQFATLKVLGFAEKRIRKIYVLQNNWLTIVSAILGAPLGYLMTNFIFTMALSDAYDFSADIGVLSYVLAIAGTFVVSLAMSKGLAKKVRKIDMVTSLKGNE